MFVWTIHDAIFAAALCFLLLLCVLAWLIFWIGRLIAWIKNLGRRARSAWAKFAHRFDYVWGN